MTETTAPALTLLAILRDEGEPMSIGRLADRSMFSDDALAQSIADLCMTGPVVAIDIHGEVHFALEWGVRHVAERQEQGLIEYENYLADQADANSL